MLNVPLNIHSKMFAKIVLYMFYALLLVGTLYLSMAHIQYTLFFPHLRCSTQFATVHFKIWK